MEADGRHFAHIEHQQQHQHQQQSVAVQADLATPLLWVLPDVLNMTGTNYGCGVAACGACSVKVDGLAVRSCVVPTSSVVGKRIQMIEALGTPAKPHALQLAWIAEQVPQCGTYQRIRVAIKRAAGVAVGPVKKVLK